MSEQPLNDPIHQPPVQPPGTVDPRSLDTQHGQQLLDGSRQLGMSVTAIMETHGPEAVSEYLDDVLADTEGRVPADERLAAFELLAGAQRSELQKQDMSAGEEMMAAMDSTTQATETELYQSGRLIHRKFNSVEEMHNQTLGTQIRRGNIRPSLLAQSHQETVGAARSGVRAVDEYDESLGRWGRAQYEAAGVFHYKIDQSKLHQEALRQATATLQAGYEGEDKDLSPVIDAEVKKAVADRLQTALTEAKTAGQSPEEAIEALLDEEPDPVLANTIQKLAAFSEQVANDAKIGAGRVRSEIEDAKAKLSAFARRGEEYAYAHRLEDAVELYQQQGRRLSGGSAEMIQAVSRGNKTIQRFRQELDDMRRSFREVQIRTAASEV